MAGYYLCSLVGKKDYIHDEIRGLCNYEGFGMGETATIARLSPIQVPLMCLGRHLGEFAPKKGLLLITDIQNVLA